MRRRALIPLATAIAAALGAGLLLTPAAPATAAAPPTPIYRDTHYSFAERAADLVSRMSLAEKVPQLRTNSAPAIPRLGVQAYTYWSEGQHGINLLGADTNHGSDSGGSHATSFPTNMASSMSWDPALMYDETTAISDEIRGELDKSLWGVAQNNIGPDRNAYGNLTYWAPTVNLDRDPRWGRTDEAFGEDPYLVTRMAGAFVDGYQGQTLAGKPMTPYLKVAATAKHFALNNAEDTRHSGSSDTSDANIRNYYTAQFRGLVEDSHVSGLMTSYNAINGTPAPADTYTANELAQRTWGFHGYTTSDCGAVGDIYGAGSHDWAPPGWTTSQQDGRIVWTNTKTGTAIDGAAGAQAYALRAGTQLNCTGAEFTLANIEQALAAGALSVGVIDDALVRLFTVRMATGEFDPRSKVAYTKITRAQIQSPKHQALARTVADNSLVLLKNQPLAATRKAVLPVAARSLHNVVVVGDLADKVTLGGYSGEPTYQRTSVQGLTYQLPDATVHFDACHTSTTATAPAQCSADTLQAMKSADLVVMMAGTDGATAGEENDRDNLALPGNYASLAGVVHAAGNPRSVLALQSDGPVDLAGIAADFPAIVFSAYNGQEQGTALTDVLLGRQNPSGHLNFTWYQNDAQLPAIGNYGLTPAETGGLGRTYQYFTGTPTYPFGYGGSYTSFAYSAVRLDRSRVDANGRVTVSFRVTNTGTRAGRTVAQLYATPPAVAGVELPRRRLVGFGKTTTLAPGRSQRMTLSVAIPDLARYDEHARREVVDAGGWNLRLSTDATHSVATLPLRVSGTVRPAVRYVTVQPDHVVFGPGESLDLTGRNPWIADVTPQAGQHAKADGIVTAVNNDESFVDMKTANVRYASDNPAVATVDSAGRVRTRAPGVATISATVGGVTGSTPIVVAQPLTLDGPVLAAPGQPFTVTARLPDPAAGVPLSDVAFALTASAGWSVHALDPTTYPRVHPGQTVAVRWRVTPPAGVAGGSADLSARVTFRSAAGPGSADAATTVNLPYASVSAAYDNVGITADSNTAPGNLDGAGRSYSADALAAATPSLSAGQPVTHDGATVTWPGAAGVADNVAASGQTIAMSGHGARLSVIGAANNGTATGEGTVVYTDGTTQKYQLAFSDWWANSAAPGSDILTSVDYLNHAGIGRESQKVSLYYAAVPLDSARTVRYVTLPHVSDGPVSGLAMHIFAAALTG